MRRRSVDRKKKSSDPLCFANNKYFSADFRMPCVTWQLYFTLPQAAVYPIPAVTNKNNNNNYHRLRPPRGGDERLNYRSEREREGEVNNYDNKLTTRGSKEKQTEVARAPNTPDPGAIPSGAVAVAAAFNCRVYTGLIICRDRASITARRLLSAAAGAGVIDA